MCFYIIMCHSHLVASKRSLVYKNIKNSYIKIDSNKLQQGIHSNYQIFLILHKPQLWYSILDFTFYFCALNSWTILHKAHKVWRHKNDTPKLDDTREEAKWGRRKADFRIKTPTRTTCAVWGSVSDLDEEPTLFA